MNLLSRIEGACAWLAGAMTRAAAVAVALIVVVLVFSSVQRYALARPIPVTEELAAFLFVAVSFLAVVGGVIDGRHIRITPLWRKLPVRWQGWAMAAGDAAGVAILSVLVVQTWGFAAASLRYGSRSYAANLLEWPWMMLIPASLATMALVLGVRVAATVARARRGLPPPEAAQGPDGAA